MIAKYDDNKKAIGDSTEQRETEDDSLRTPVEIDPLRFEVNPTLELWDPLEIQFNKPIFTEQSRLLSPSTEAWTNPKTPRTVTQKRKLGSSSNDKGISSQRRCVRWTEREDIFLTGIILDVYCVRHSLKPSTKGCKKSGELVWQHIHERYNFACKKYSQITGAVLPERTVKALRKRWKDTAISTENEVLVGATNKTMEYFKLWDLNYKLKYDLTKRYNKVDLR